MVRLKRHRIRRWWLARQARLDRYEIAVEAGHRIRCQAETGVPCPHVVVTQAMIETNPVDLINVIKRGYYP